MSEQTIDQYVVIGNPIAHSKSPLIHQTFASLTGESLHYDRLLAPLDGFTSAVQAFVAAGGKGMNVTVPFKLEAFNYAQTQGRLTARAALAGAVNTLKFTAEGVVGDNTDGAGLVRDITQNQHISLTGKRVLLLGAGGASRGALGPLLDEQPAALVIANRTKSKAIELAALGNSPLASGCGLDELSASFEVIINASSSSLSAERLPIPASIFAGCELAYDMMYAAEPTPFLLQAKEGGAQQLSDGIGMLIEQAAEAFFIWRGVRPATASVFAQLRPAS